MWLWWGPHRTRRSAGTSCLIASNKECYEDFLFRGLEASVGLSLVAIVVAAPVAMPREAKLLVLGCGGHWHLCTSLLGLGTEHGNFANPNTTRDDVRVDLARRFFLVASFFLFVLDVINFWKLTRSWGALFVRQF